MLIVRLLTFFPLNYKLSSGLLLLVVLITSALEVQLIASSIPAMESFSNQIVGADVFYFLFCFVITSLARIALIVYRSYFAQIVGLYLSDEVISRYYTRDYAHIRADSEDQLVAVVLNKINQCTRGYLLPWTQILNFFWLAVFSGFYFFSSLTEDFIFVGFGVVAFYAGFMILTRGAMDRLSQVNNYEQTTIVELIRSSSDGIREIILRNIEREVFQRMHISQKKLRTALAKIQIFGELPRYLMEFTGALVLLSIVLWGGLQSSDSDGLTLLAALGVFAVAASRILPAAQQAFAGWSSMKGNYHSVIDVLDLLDDLSSQLPVGELIHGPVNMPSVIQVKGCSFDHSGNYSEPLLDDVNITIRRGDRIALMGVSGSGKSTFVDILAGFLKPGSGSIVFDGEDVNLFRNSSWQTQITFASQLPLIFKNFSIAENVTLSPLGGVSDIKAEEIDASLSSASLAHTCSSDLNVAALSGGERQRVGLARSLFRPGSFIIFDEPTSALDDETSEHIIASILGLPPMTTVIVITHDPKVADCFDRKLIVESRRVREVQ